MNTCTNHMIIFSVTRPDTSTSENFRNHMLAGSLLKSLNVGFQELGGLYKGQAEVSFAVNVPFTALEPTLAEIRKIAKRYNQDSILYVDNEKNAYVDDLIGSVERVGKYLKLTRDEALRHKSYNVDLHTGDFYAVVK